jgi:heme-degrading monooxygenase HmoA
MYVSITTSRVNGKDAVEFEKFLADFLPKVKEQPGAEVIYHYSRPGKSDECSVVIWRDEESFTAYDKGELAMERLSFELNHGIKSVREAYPTSFFL